MICTIDTHVMNRPHPKLGLRRLKEYVIDVHKKLEDQEKDTELICKRLEYANEKNENLEIRRREFEQIADRMTDARNRVQEELDNFKRYQLQSALLNR